MHFGIINKFEHRPTIAAHNFSLIQENIMPSNIPAFIATHPWILIVAAIWTIPWKGVALWRAARNQSIIWFVILLVVNTLAILDIIYIFFFSKRKLPPQQFEATEVKNLEKRVLDIRRD